MTEHGNIQFFLRFCFFVLFVCFLSESSFHQGTFSLDTIYLFPYFPVI